MFKQSGHKADGSQIVKSQNIGDFIHVLSTD